MAYRIGADIGGTFTDLILVDADTGRFEIGKTLTTPSQPDDAVISGVADLLGRTGVAPGDVEHVVHGTTLFTNALIERKGAATALIASEGFRDAVEIGREHRYDMYDLAMERPTPLAPRRRRFEVPERVLADGSVRTPLDEDAARALIPRLADHGVEAVAVCFMHAYANPTHERRMGALLAELAPDLAVSLSSDVSPEIREYDRTSTTLANVYVKRIAERYLERLKSRLVDELGVGGALYVMQSNGGMAEVATATRYPIRLVESGPAAGALAAAHMATTLGMSDLLSFDMGGTTAKASVIADGAPLIATEFEVDRRYQFKKGSGLPVKTPVIEMIEIGAGGGSLARIDALGRLRVGPESAGAVPGPVCYRRGGTEPAVTDADLALGYLDPNFFLGGEMALDVDGAKRALVETVGAPLGLPEPRAERAAWSVHRLVNEAMASAARLHAVERGKDVERFPLFAFGGAGPVHAYGVARILRAPSVVYPFGAGAMSALGLLTAPLSVDFVRSLPGLLDRLDWSAASAAVAEMIAEGRAMLQSAVPTDQIRARISADMRYRKQGYEIRAAAPDQPLDPAMAAPLRAAFEKEYAALYGRTAPDNPVEIVSWRVIVEGPKPTIDFTGAETHAAGVALKGRRPAWSADADGFVDTPVYDRYALSPGDSFSGPAIIEERESTVVINGPADIRVDAARNVVATLR